MMISKKNNKLRRLAANLMTIAALGVFSMLFSVQTYASGCNSTAETGNTTMRKRLIKEWMDSLD